MVDCTRRTFLHGLAAASLPALGGLDPQAAMAANPRQPTFGLEDVARRARDLASVPFDASLLRLPPGLDALDFDAWRDIRFRNERAILGELGSPFRLRLFHLGYLFRRAVTINTVREGIATPIPYAGNLFDYGRHAPKTPPPVNFGFAGFRLHYPLNRPAVLDEVVEFLGASYFRFLGRDQTYGLSARAIAVDVGSEAEDFPFFREFWVVVPEKDATTVTILGLLDSESLTGAFRFEVTPAVETAVEVTTTLFPRRAIGKLGIAPLSSMFFIGKTSRRFVNDYRGELHDSDGMFLRTDVDERIWRPLQNPVRQQISHFHMANPKAFGLMQRDRDFDHYQDIGLNYETRPSYLVEPHGDWGQGGVELVEMPTGDETNDNVAAFWNPDEAAVPGKVLTYSYRLTAILDGARLSPGGYAVNTFVSSAAEPGLTGRPTPGQQRFIIDFTGGDLDYFTVQPDDVQLVPSVTSGTILRSSLIANPHVRGFRGFVDVALPVGETTELRAFLKAGSRALTETWTFRWTSA